MTREETIKWIERINAKYIHGGDESFDAQRSEALGMAISALRAQQDAEKNEPLTLDELREMGGEPLYIHSRIFLNDCGWRVVGLADVLRVYFTDGSSLSLTDYDKSWLAYRRKPEEVKK